ncbi:MAG: glycosyltransferase family 4 protein, partial [Caldilineaceae bacterium]
IAISHSTAADIVRIYPDVDPAKVTTIHLAADNDFFAARVEPNAEVLSGRPYFLYVGNRARYKNFAALVQAFGKSGLAPTHDLRVVSPSHGAFDGDEEALLRECGVDGAIHLPTSVDDAALRALYQSALALVYPSLYEGFGLPLLEALASGTLIATSSVSSMPEIGGPSALLFDPTSVDEISAALVQIANLGEQERAERVAQGRDWAAAFTWDKCVRETVALLKQVGHGLHPARLL